MARVTEPDWRASTSTTPCFILGMEGNGEVIRELRTAEDGEAVRHEAKMGQRGEG